mmetsp:Transcript_38146/g.89462  ORF Transcript_38146/g.89462 Transcript_38146/m.89462 type:complete len:105 (-) Transcript_38146:107-421(-)
MMLGLVETRGRLVAIEVEVSATVVRALLFRAAAGGGASHSGSSVKLSDGDFSRLGAMYRLKATTAIPATAKMRTTAPLSTMRLARSHESVTHRSHLSSLLRHEC